MILSRGRLSFALPVVAAAFFFGFVGAPLLGATGSVELEQPCSHALRPGIQQAE
jgi:hypothetical protein